MALCFGPRLPVPVFTGIKGPPYLFGAGLQHCGLPFLNAKTAGGCAPGCFRSFVLQFDFHGDEILARRGKAAFLERGFQGGIFQSKVAYQPPAAAGFCQSPSQ